MHHHSATPTCYHHSWRFSLNQLFPVHILGARLVCFASRGAARCVVGLAAAGLR